MGHDKKVMFAWSVIVISHIDMVGPCIGGTCDILHRIEENTLSPIYVVNFF